MAGAARRVVHHQPINGGQAYLTGLACINFESSSVLAATWGTTTTKNAGGSSLTVEQIWTKSGAMDTCNGGPYVAFAYSNAIVGTYVSYGTSNVGYGYYRTCQLHGYWMYGEYGAKPIGGAWGWRTGGWASGP